jgi:hypothetical protein
MARRVLVVTTADARQSEVEVESLVRAHAGEDAELQVIAPASKISWLDWLTNPDPACTRPG